MDIPDWPNCCHAYQSHLTYNFLISARFQAQWAEPLKITIRVYFADCQTKTTTNALGTEQKKATYSTPLFATRYTFLISNHRHSASRTSSHPCRRQRCSVWSKKKSNLLHVMLPAVEKRLWTTTTNTQKKVWKHPPVHSATINIIAHGTRGLCC